MTCKECSDVKEPDEGTWHVLRPCPRCGREIRVAEPGKHGIGLKINKGDKVVAPPLVLSPNPLKGGGHFTRSGIGWYAEHAFIGDLPRRKDDFPDAVSAAVESLEQELKASPLFKDVDFENENQVSAAITSLKKEDNPIEWYLSSVLIFTAVAKDAIRDGDSGLASWAMAMSERLRSMLVFKQQFEEVVFMGNSAKRLIDVLQLWRANDKNSDEQFWQIKLQEASYVFSQLFSSPITFLRGKAYVGGQQIDGKSARFIDLLFSGDSTGDAILIEIKTPMTPLVQKRKYRSSIHSPSAELSGATVQVADYRATLVTELQTIGKGHAAKISGFNPKAVLIVGNSAELDTYEERRSFDLYRASLANIDIITFDELFQKIEHLAKIFNLSRTP
jgi:Domain of unknown function (DUF4263)